MLRCLSYSKLCLVLIITAALNGCMHYTDTESEGGRATDPESEALLHGSIAYPFVEPVKRLGESVHQEDYFVIKSSVADRQYSIEIPGSADDYDVEVPLAGLSDGSGTIDATGTYVAHPNGMASPSTADQEVVNNLPKIENRYPSETQSLDKAFGVGPDGGPQQSPSYLLSIAKINAFYKSRNYEYALVEADNLIAFYPNSPKLLKMKGTILSKMNLLELALRSWDKALILSPSDSVLKAAIERLQKRASLQKSLQPAPPSGQPGVTPPPPTTPSMSLKEKSPVNQKSQRKSF